MSEKPRDPNPVFQSVIETAREFYKGMRKGERRNVSCVKDLLDRSEGTVGAYARLAAWAQGLGFPVAITQGERSPEIVTVTIIKP